MTRDYPALITSGHSPQPRFRATVELLTGAVDSITTALRALPEAFRVDTAVGVQLDTVGLWTGVKREQPIPIQDAYFTWDDPARGWNAANWKGPFEAVEGISRLDDDTYRAIIKAKIGSNYWDGSDSMVNTIGATAFQQLGVQCFVLDNMDMSVTIYILGNPSLVMIEMIKRGIAPPKAAGVRVAAYILASLAGTPLFALSVPTTTVTAGLDFGSFGAPT